MSALPARPSPCRGDAGVSEPCWGEGTCWGLFC